MFARHHRWIATQCRVFRNGSNSARLLVLALAGSAALALAAPAAGQDLHPSRRPSPIGIAKTHIGEVYVKVTYGRPYIRGRQIFGTPTDTATFLVPYGELWRTGANEATELTTSAALLVAGRRLEAGTYAIFTVPGANTWAVRFSPQLGLDGTSRFDEATGQFGPGYDAEQDVLRVVVSSTGTDDIVDQFTVEFERTTTGADLVLRWERTVVRLPLAAAGR